MVFILHEEFKSQLEQKVIDVEKYDILCKKLMSMPVLRDMAPEWANAAVNKLLESKRRDDVETNGMNTIRYAWYRLYIKFINDEQFISKAVISVIERNEAKTTELLREIAFAEKNMNDSEIPTVETIVNRENPIKKRKSNKDVRIQQATDRVLAAEVAETGADDPADRLLNPKKKSKKATIGMSERKCGNCRQKGHNKTTCSNPQNVAVITSDYVSAATDPAG